MTHRIKPTVQVRIYPTNLLFEKSVPIDVQAQPDVVSTIQGIYIRNTDGKYYISIEDFVKVVFMYTPVTSRFLLQQFNFTTIYKNYQTFLERLHLFLDIVTNLEDTEGEISFYMDTIDVIRNCLDMRLFIDALNAMAKIDIINLKGANDFVRIPNTDFEFVIVPNGDGYKFNIRLFDQNRYLSLFINNWT